MFKSKTLFIVGAGASNEVGLPTGNELKSEIARLVDIGFRGVEEQISGDSRVANALRIRASKIDKQPAVLNYYLDACRRIRDAMPQDTSIDNFIENQGDDKIAICGKIAIVRAILEAEKNSFLYIDYNNAELKLDFEKIKDTWHAQLWQLLMNGCNKRNVPNIFENISFISFNYDRCIEHYLFFALQNYYGLDSAYAAGYVRALDVVHPYGVVGQVRLGSGLITSSKRWRRGRRRRGSFGPACRIGWRFCGSP